MENEINLEPEVTSSNAPAADVIAMLQAHRTVTFADFLELNWPEGLSEDCIAAEAGTDCIEMDLPDEQYCITCATYASICREWYASPFILNRRSA
jgi:hypothetical protein